MSRTEFRQNLKKGYQAALAAVSFDVRQSEQGWVESVMGSVVTISGLKHAHAQYYELLYFENQTRGMIVSASE